MAFLDKVTTPGTQKPVQSGGFLGAVAIPSSGFDVDKFTNLQREGEQAQLKSKQINSPLGQAREFAKAVPGNLWDVLAGNVTRVGATIAELPRTFTGKEATQKTYKPPLLPEGQSFQTSIENAATEYYTKKANGEKITAADRAKLTWAIAQAPLAVLDVLGIGKGISKVPGSVAKSAKATDIPKNVGSDLYEAFMPTLKKKTDFASKVSKEETVTGSGKVYSGQPTGTSQSGFFTENADTAAQYAKINKTVTGTSDVIEKDISGLKFKKVPQEEALDAIEDATLKDIYDGVVFVNKQDGSNVYKVFDDTFTPKTAEDIRVRAITNKLADKQDDFDMVTMPRMKMQDQARQALELVSKDRQKALSIALGKTAPEGNLKPGSVFTALREEAMKEGDIETLRRLTKSTVASETAQELKAFDTFEPNDPVKTIRQVQKFLQTRAEKNTRIDVIKEKTKIASQIKKEIKPVKRETWEGFINNLKCNY